MCMFRMFGAQVDTSGAAPRRAFSHQAGGARSGAARLAAGHGKEAEPGVKIAGLVGGNQVP
jgi:hypothetical protein